MKPTQISSKQWRLYNLYFLLEHFLGLKFSRKYLSNRKIDLINSIKRNSHIDRRGQLSPSENITSRLHVEALVNDAEYGQRPVLLKGAARHWPCMEWTDDFFGSKYGDYPVHLVENIGASESRRNYVKTDLSAFVNTYKTEQKAYLRVCRVLDDHPELKEDLDMQFIDKLLGGLGKDDAFFLFIGEEGTNTTMHSEIPLNVFVQVKGSKRWAIYPPEERMFLGPEARRQAYYHTKANPFNPDHESYPLLSDSRGYEVVTEEGDVLVNPPFYWHYVENLSDNIAISIQHLDLSLAFKQSRLLSILFFLRTNPTFIQSVLHKNNRDFDVQVIMQGKKISEIK